MAGVFSRIPANTFEHLGVNAGMVLKNFDPYNAVVSESDLLGPTTGGNQFNASVEHTDWGDDIDNCPKNTKELMRVDDETAKASGTFVALTPEIAEWLMAHCDQVTENGVTKLTPRTDINIDDDFRNLWIVGDYSNINTGENAGFLAVHLMNALSTGGFQLQTNDKQKMQFSYEFTGHYSLDAQDVVPYEVYIKKGSSGDQKPEVLIDRHNATVKVGDTVQFSTIRKIPSSATVTWTSSATAKATVDSTGKVTGVATGNTIITASITVDGVSYTDTCTVIVEAAE